MNFHQYTYDALDKESDEIRLISIQPHADPSSPVELNIIHANLSDKPVYEALSYMWGSDDNPKFVEIGEKRIGVGVNLWFALERLRSPSEERVLWVDAICIDQRNVLERNHQVSQMSRIYRQAWRVAAWLGRDDFGNGRAAVDFFKILADRSNSELARNHSQYELDLAFYFCKLPYWSRLWIMQEVVLAGEIILYLGPDELDWDSFATVIKRQITFDGLSIKDSTPANLVQQRMIHKLTEQKGLLNFTSSSIPELSHRFAGAACRDTRDHIFGLMALANGCCQAHTPIDYSISGLGLCKSVLDHYFISHGPNITISAKIEVVVRLYSFFRTKASSGLSDVFDPGLDQVHLVHHRVNGFQGLTGRIIWVGTIPLRTIFENMNASPIHKIQMKDAMPWNEEVAYYTYALNSQRDFDMPRDSKMWDGLKGVRRAEFEKYISEMVSALQDTTYFGRIQEQNGVNIALDEHGFFFFTPRAVVCGDFIGISERRDKLAILRPRAKGAAIIATADATEKKNTVLYYPPGPKDNTLRLSLHHSFVNLVWFKPTQQEEEEYTEDFRRIE